MGRTWVLALIGGIMFGTGAKGDQIDDLVGGWHSAELVVSDAAERKPEEVRLSIEGDSRGFTVVLDLGDDGLDSVSFAPTSKDGVYSVAESGGLFSFFRGESSADPLSGEPLIWARMTDRGIAIYNLQINSSGRFKLADLRLERDGNSVKLSYFVQRSGAVPLLVEALLSEDS